VLLQFTKLTMAVFCCNGQPVEREGQKTATVSVVVRKMENDGASGQGCRSTHWRRRRGARGGFSAFLCPILAAAATIP